MQDKERKPDLIGDDDGAIEKKVDAMLDAGTEKSRSKKIEIKADEPADSEVVDLPQPKEPLKIKILKQEPEESEKVEPTTAPEPLSTKINVFHADDATATDTTEPAAPEPEAEEDTQTDTAPVVTDDTESTEAGTLEEAAEVEEQQPETSEESDAETSEEPAVETDEAAPETDESPETPDGSEEVEKLPETSTEEPLLPAFEDDKTAEAVSDVVAHEGDELLAADDEKIAAAFQTPTKPTLGGRLKHLLSAWWHNPKARWLTFTFLFLGLVVAGIVPASRYFLLNTAQVRSSLSMQALDASTGQPLKNVKITIGGVNGVTGTDGSVQLARVKLGPSSLLVEKRAFASIRQPVTVGWGSNPLGEFKLTPTGTQYSFTVTDYLSGKAVEGVEASNGEASALSDENGKIKLTMDQPPDQFDVALKGTGYRDETLKIEADIKTDHPVKLVPARKEVFISKRSGKYDVYKIDIDGKNEQKILAGTGLERPDMVLAPHPNDEVVALVSTRDDKRNQDGFLLSTLTLIDLSNNSTNSVAQSEQIQVLDWIGDYLIYVQIAQGTSAANPKRQRLMSYDYKTNDNKEITTANYFNDVGVYRGKIYYAPSSTGLSSGSIGLFKIDADGSNRQTILSDETWSFIRPNFDHLNLSVSKDWYDYHIGDKTATKLPGQPGNLVSRLYIDSPDAKNSLWVDNRDGKGVLLAFELSSGNEKTLRTQSGLKNPIRWLNNKIVIYRINTEQETADYALSLDGGDPYKIKDVTNTSSIDQWYYY